MLCLLWKSCEKLCSVLLYVGIYYSCPTPITGTMVSVWMKSFHCSMFAGLVCSVFCRVFLCGRPKITMTAYVRRAGSRNCGLDLSICLMENVYVYIYILCLYIHLFTHCFCFFFFIDVFKSLLYWIKMNICTVLFWCRYFIDIIISSTVDSLLQYYLNQKKFTNNSNIK